MTPLIVCRLLSNFMGNSEPMVTQVNKGHLRRYLGPWRLVPRVSFETIIPNKSRKKPCVCIQDVLVFIS